MVHTCLFVEQYLELFDGVVVKCLFDAIDGLFVSHLAVHKTATGTLLHNLGPIVAGDSAEWLRAVNNGIVDDLGIRKQKAAIGYK